MLMGKSGFATFGHLQSEDKVVSWVRPCPATMSLHIVYFLHNLLPQEKETLLTGNT